jgi:4-hydroxythreonine-4-phosphate dehydrogenase
MNKIYITMGDPRGIGPEIITKSLQEIISKNDDFIPVLIGDRSLFEKAAQELSFEIYGLENDIFETGKIYCIDLGITGHPGVDSLSYINKAIELCLVDSSGAMVTSPVIKEAIAQAMPGFIGHTEYLAKRAGVEKVVMSFISDEIKLSLMTTHLPLNKVSSSIDKGSIIRHIGIIDENLKKWFKIENPKFVMCSLNPHGGEEGLLGDEENDVFIPALEDLRKKGIKIEGPYGAPHAIKLVLNGEYDFIISPYHDQVLTAVKAFLKPTVNLTMGLPFIRTSPDHGPAIDIVGKEPADHRSMKSAIELAIKLVK